MLEVLPESKGNILWLRASGKLTDEDYREVFLPQMEAVVAGHGKVRLLFHLDYDFQGWTVGGLWEDLKLDWKYKDAFEKVALVGGSVVVSGIMDLIGHFMSGEVRTFVREQLAEAWAWIQGMPDLMPPYQKKELT